MSLKTTWNRWKMMMGKNNPAYIRCLEYYNLYHHLPLVEENPCRYRGVWLFFLIAIAGANLLFTYGFIKVITDSKPASSFDYWTVVLMFPFFVILFSIAAYFIVKAQIKSHRRWKSFEDAFVAGEGTVIGKWYESTVQVDNVGGMEYFIAIQYLGNKRVKASIPSKKYSKIKINDKVKIRFVRFQPEVCELIKC